MARQAIHIDSEELYRLYVVECLSQAEIARRLGCCQNTVARNLSRHGITREAAAAPAPSQPAAPWDPEQCHPGLPCWEDCLDDPSRACSRYDTHHPQGKSRLGAPAAPAEASAGPNGDRVAQSEAEVLPTNAAEFRTHVVEAVADILGPEMAPAPDPDEPNALDGLQDLDEILAGADVRAVVERRLLLDCALWPTEAEDPTAAAVTYDPDALFADEGGLVSIRAADRDGFELLVSGYQVLALWQFLVDEGLIAACVRDRNSDDNKSLSPLPQGAAQ